ncbi:RteC domain-containing protein [Alistipes indistinctus]|uniref:RteC domain-containing protein n=1 Tax=Alistipes indistinctus TaxID=626932 RepID=UPI0009FEA466|nr:RteC domain-containing protein [Alistipes indistinctus]UWN59684.1 RteC domain-containing protein [Alistipes indistinctus YIT 12060]
MLSLLDIEIDILANSPHYTPPLGEIGFHNTDNSFPFHWTASARDLVELIYALFYCNCFDNGKVTIHDLAVFLGRTFGIEINSIYHIFSKARLRKKERAPFIKNLYEKLIGKMDEMDG